MKSSAVTKNSSRSPLSLLCRQLTRGVHNFEPTARSSLSLFSDWMMNILLLLGCLGLLGCLAVPVEIPLKSTEFATTFAGLGYTRVADPPGNKQLQIDFHLSPRNMDQIHAIASDVSNPRSSNYGKYKSSTDIAAIVAAPDADLNLVSNFLNSYSISTRVLATRHVVRAHGSVSQFSSALNCTLGGFSLPAKPNRLVVRKIGSHYLPADVSALVTYISLISDVPPKRMGVHKRQPKRTKKQPTMQSSAPMGNFQALGCSNLIGFTFVSTTAPSPYQPLVVTGNPLCEGGTTSYTDLTGCSPVITSVVATFTLGDPLQQNWLASPYETITLTSCPNGMEGMSLCTFNTNLLVPMSASVAVSVTTNYFDGTSNTTQCNIMPSISSSSPQLLWQTYKIPQNYQVRNLQASLGLYEVGENFVYSDVQQFGQSFGINMGNISYFNNTVDNDDVSNSGESALDMQIALSMIRNASVTYWNNDNFSNYGAGFADVINTMLDNLAGTPMVLSVSYGFDETNPGITQAADALAMLATTGKTIVAASGDNGAMGNQCNFNNPGPMQSCQACCDAGNFGPTFPTSNPYVLSVGATQISQGGWNNNLAQNELFNGVSGEIVCSAVSNGVITSGGGYSQTFPALPHQIAAITNYLLNAPNSSSPVWPAFNGSTMMRGYPDVALSGANYDIFLEGEQSQEYGTSASSPLMASMITILNDVRLRNGMPPMGFIAPFLYQLGANFPQVFNDVTLGDNNVANPSNSDFCSVINCPYGLSAAVGWDAVSGWGSVNFDLLMRYALSPDWNIYDAPHGAQGAQGVPGVGGVNGSQGLQGVPGAPGEFAGNGIVLAAIAISVISLVAASIGAIVAVVALRRLSPQASSARQGDRYMEMQAPLAR